MKDAGTAMELTFQTTPGVPTAGRLAYVPPTLVWEDVVDTDTDPDVDIENPGPSVDPDVLSPADSESRRGPGHHPKVVWHGVGSHVFAVHRTSGRAIEMNSSAAFVWKQLSGLGPRETAVALANRYAVDLSRATLDVEAFMAILYIRDFLVE